MSTFIHGIAASENIDSSGERISIAGLDISSLDKDGVFNYEHEAAKVPDKDGRPVDLQIKIPAQVVGKILKAKKIFSKEDCDDEHQLHFWNKCQTPYLYVMGELFDDYTDAARDLAGKFRYDADRKHERNVCNFSIEGAKIEKAGMDILRSIGRKVTITVLPCNKAAAAEMVPVVVNKKDDINSLFKTETVEVEILKMEGLSTGASNALEGVSDNTIMASDELRKDQPKLTVAKPPMAPKPIGATKTGKNIFAQAKIHEYGDFGAQDHRDAANVHLGLAGHFGEKGDHKQAKFHQGKGILHQGRANTLMDRQARISGPKKPTATMAPAAPKAPNTLFHPKLSGKMAPPGTIKKALDAGSALTSAPSELTGGAALGTGFNPKKKKKDKSKWLTIAEDSYEAWEKREKFEAFMSARMPHLTKGEIKAIGQVMMLKKAQEFEAALAKMANISFNDSMEKAAGKDSVYTLLLFEGCDLHDVLHCSHFATDDVESANKIKEVCDKYFADKREAKELAFDKQGTLGKEDQPVLFLTEGDPYKDLLEKLKEVATYKYGEFKPHVSVTSNVDSFKGKVAKLVISVNGEVKHTYELSEKVEQK